MRQFLGNFISLGRTLTVLLAVCTLVTATARAAISGTRTVGPTGNYATLTAAIADIQAQTLNGALILELQAAYVSTGETFPLNFTNLTTTATNTLTVRPQSGASGRVITGAAAQTLNLNNGSFVTFDGRAGGVGVVKNLAIENNSTAGVAVQFINEASNNTFKFVTLRGQATNTTAGIVVFSTTTGPNGNDGNTLDTCDLTSTSGGTPTNGICSIGTAGAANSGNVVTNCSISNFFNPATATAGVLLGANNTAWSILACRLTQAAARTFTTGNLHVGIQVTSGEGHEISGNTIGGLGGWAIQGLVPNRFTGIDLAVGAAPTSVQGNSITNFQLATSSNANGTNAIWCGINLRAGSANIGNLSLNAISTAYVGSTAADSLCVGINLATSGTALVQGNQIGDLFNANAITPAINANVMGIRCASSGPVTITQNSIGVGIADSMQAGLSGYTTGSSGVSGIALLFASSLCTITDNTIQNLTAYGTGASGYVRGIWGYNGGSSSNSTIVTGNVISDLKTDSTSSGFTVGLVGAAGINLTFGNNNLVAQNTINNIARTSPGTGKYIVGGIVAYADVNMTISGNKIHGLTNAGTSTQLTSPALVAGVLIYGGAIAVNVVNNMISLGTGQTSDTLFVGILAEHSTFPIPTDRIYHNSINITGTASSGVQSTFGFHRGNFTSTTVTAPLDFRNNLVTNTRTGGTGGHYAIGDNFNAVSSNTGWGVNASNYNVLNANPATVGYWNGAQTFAGWKTAAEGESSSVSGITVNYVNGANDLHLAMGTTATPLESGGVNIATVTTDFDSQARPGPAGSVNGGAVFPDIGADEFDGVVLDIVAPTVTFSPLAVAHLTGETVVATIADLTGVPTTGTLRPRLYYRKGAGPWVSRAGQLTSGNTNSGQWSFDLVPADVGGLSTGDVISYYFIAQDTTGTPRIGSLPAGVTATDVNSVSAPPPNPFTVTAYPELTGSYTVGAGGTYATLTDAIANYNSGFVTGPVTFLLTDATYPGETFPLVIKNIAAASATNSLTIKPAPGTSPVLSGSSASALIQLDGARYVTIDGTNGTTQNSLSPRVTASRDLTINNADPSGLAVIWMSTAGDGSGVKHCTVQNCVILGTGAAGDTRYGLGVGGQTIGQFGVNNDDVSFINNAVKACWYAIYSRGEQPSNKNTGFVAHLNTIGADAPGPVSVGGIIVLSTDGVSVRANQILNITSSRTQETFGISVGASDVTQSSAGFNDDIRNAVVTDNLIGSVQKSSTFTAVGIAVGHSESGTILVANNMISGVAANATGGDLGAGILVGGGTATVRVLHNTVAMQGTLPGAVSGSAFSTALAVVSNIAPTALEVRNNIFSNTQAGNAGATTRFFSVYYRASAPYPGVTSDRNALFCAGAGPGTYALGRTAATSRPTLADWQTAAGQDANSLNVSPTFVSATDLHLADETSPVLGAGATLAAVTTDIDLQARRSPPDIGADEFFSTNANLASLTTSAGTLSPTFSGATLNYIVGVANAITQATVTPTAASSRASLTVKGSPLSSGATSSAIALTEGDNTIPIEVTAEDGVTSKTYQVTVHRNAKPVLGLPSSPVVALTTSLAGLPVSFTATATDSEDGPLTPTLSAQSGDTFPYGETTITVSATDSAGDTVQGQFIVAVRLSAPVNTPIIAKGTAAPGASASAAGLPTDAILASFNPPATDDDGNLAYIAKWTSNNGKVKGTGLFLNNTCLAIVGGDASAVGGTGAKWKTLGDPVVSAGHVVCLATLSGVPKTGAAFIVGNLTGTALEKIAQSGDPAAGATVGGATFKSFKAVSVQGARITFLAQLTAGTGTPKVTAANDLGLWFYEPGNPLFVVRESDDVAGKKIKTLVSFKPGNGSPGQGRGTLINSTVSGDPVVTALALFTDKSQGLITQNIDDGPPSLALSLSGVAASGVDDGETFASYGPPARNRDETTAFLARLTLSTNVSKTTASGIFTGPDGTGKFATVARVGTDAPLAETGVKFSLLKDPVLSDDGDLAFPATLKGGTAKGAAAQTIWWKPAGQPLQLLAQGGADAGDLTGAKWKAFTSLAIAGGGRGPIFIATLTPNKTNVSKATANGVWACDSAGVPRLLFRTGVLDAIVAGKTLKSFTLLKATVGSTGVTRSFNNAAEVVWLATFSDKSQAIVTTTVP